MGTRIMVGGHEIRMERAITAVSSNLPKPDDHWRFTDAAGHAHAYDADAASPNAPYPTLRTVESERYYCLDCNDEHTDSHFECVRCGERITPTLKLSVSREYLFGVAEYYIDGELATREQCDVLMGRSFGPRGDN